MGLTQWMAARAVPSGPPTSARSGPATTSCTVSPAATPRSSIVPRLTCRVRTPTDTAHRKNGPSNDHCIGIATASKPTGPFKPNSEPLICDLANGGAIDASGFEAPGGGLYVLWKVDGNSEGKPTPIKTQHVGANGYDLLGSPTTLITNDPIDGGLIEAPSMIYWDGCACFFCFSRWFGVWEWGVLTLTGQGITCSSRRTIATPSTTTSRTPSPGASLGPSRRFRVPMRHSSPGERRHYRRHHRHSLLFLRH